MSDFRDQCASLVEKFKGYEAQVQSKVEQAVQNSGTMVQRTAMEKASIGVPTRPVKYRSGMVSRNGNSVVPAYDSAAHANQPPYLRSGLLRASITIRADRDESSFFVAVGSAAPYAKWVELGTSKAPPHPFLVPSLDENRDAIEATIKAAVVEARRDA